MVGDSFLLVEIVSSLPPNIIIFGCDGVFPFHSWRNLKEATTSTAYCAADSEFCCGQEVL